MFEIAPRQGAASFQVGYLGLLDAAASVQGDVLIKLDMAEEELKLFHTW